MKKQLLLICLVFSVIFSTLFVAQAQYNTGNSTLRRQTDSRRAWKKYNDERRRLAKRRYMKRRYLKRVYYKRYIAKGYYNRSLYKRSLRKNYYRRNFYRRIVYRRR